MQEQAKRDAAAADLNRAEEEARLKQMAMNSTLEQKAYIEQQRRRKQEQAQRDRDVLVRPDVMVVVVVGGGGS